jgi:hypothetical protein
MLKTAGHVAKHYKPCCNIFEDFLKRGTSNATLEEYMKAVEIYAKTIKDDDARLTFKGDMLEILAEIFFKAFANDPRVGLRNYAPIPLDEDYGVDGQGCNANGKKCAVQVKYRANPLDLVTYAEIARTYASGVVQLGLDLKGDNCIFVFTTANGVNFHCETVFKKMLRILNRPVIENEINNNASFWQLAFNEIRETLLAVLS